MKQYLSLLLLSLSAYGADQSVAADVSCSEITCDYSEFGKAELTPRVRASVNCENHDETPLLQLEPDYIFKKMRRASNIFNNFQMLTGTDLTPHANSIITCMDKSKESYTNFEALAQQARDEKWPAIEQTVIALFMAKHHHSPAKEQKRLRKNKLMFWRKAK